MESVQAVNENTPLLENGAISNEPGQLIQSFAPFTLETSLENRQSLSKEKDADSNEKNVVVTVPSNNCQKTNEVSQEEIAQALCAAYLQSGPSYDNVTLDYFKEKELYIMHLAWEKVTKGKISYAESIKNIPEAVAEAIARKLYRLDYIREDSRREMREIMCLKDKQLLTANLMEEWKTITVGFSFPLRYKHTIFVDSDEAKPAVSNFLIGLVDLYDKIHDFIFNHTFQFILHSLMLIWPISILVVGTKYMECPMSHHLSYLVMMLGCIGCLAVVLRLILIHLISHEPPPEYWTGEQNGLKLLEFSFLIVFVVQAVRLFSIDPLTEPDPNKCVKNFYSAGLWMNYVSIVFISVYVFVYFIQFCLRRFNVWFWIFKFLK